MPVRDAESTIEEQLEALAAQDYDGEWELIIADNGSTDRTLDIVGFWSSKIPTVRIVDASSQVGINHARNSGSTAAHGDFLIFCDADDIVTPGWLAAMAQGARVADMVGGRLEDRKLNRYPTTEWGLNLAPDGLPVALGFLPYAVGCNFGIRATLLRELGGWNEDYAGGGDEVELCWRAQLREYKLRYEADATIHYRYREGVRALARQRYRYGVGSARLYRDFRGYGIRRSNLIAGFRVWKRLLRRIGYLFVDEHKRGLWIRDASYSLGLLVGIVRAWLSRR